MPREPDGDGWLLVHDYERDRDPGRWLALGLAIAIGLLAAWLGWRARAGEADSAPALMAGLIALGLLVTGVLVPLRERRLLLAAWRAGSVQRLEGRISEHRVWREQRSSGPVKALSDTSTLWTSIKVGATTFEFLAWPYERAMARRGLVPVALHDGLLVRIVHVASEPGAADDPRARRMLRFECRPGGAPR